MIFWIRTPLIFCTLAGACLFQPAVANRAPNAGETATDLVRELEQARDLLASTIASNDVNAELNALRRLGNAQLELGMHAEFLATSLRAARSSAALQDLRTRALILRDLSHACQLNGRSEQAIEEARNSIVLLLPLQDHVAIAQGYLFLIHVLNDARRHGEALNLTRPLHELCDKTSDPLCHARVHHATARVLLGMGKGADALPFLTKAERTLLGATGVDEQFQLATDRVAAMLSVGSLHHARIALDEAAVHLPPDAPPHQRLRHMELAYELSLAERKWETALTQLQELKHLGDSLAGVRARLNMAGLQVLHDLDTKEQDNAYLRDINARQQETIAGQRSHNHYLMALSGVSLVLVIMLVRINRQRRLVMLRLKNKSTLIHRQNEEIQAKVLELERQNMRLTECIVSEEEKDLVLKEIHHRVKNNLQVVDSMLNLQVSEIEDRRVQGMLKEAQGRVRAMAMVHENIYRSSDGPGSSLRAHMERLGRGVLVAHGVHDRISISVDSNLPAFTIETMLPLSLIVNELLTNSIKHAFAERPSGNIKIRIVRAGNHYELSYTDEGPGQMTGTNPGQGSFGRELVEILAHQLNGSVETGAGGALSLTFTPDREMLRKAG
jgi:two-component sensor histidine kinase